LKFDPSSALNIVTAAMLIWVASQLFENSRDITANRTEVKNIAEQVRENKTAIKQLEGKQ
jgi:hypothetical protein